MDFIYYVELVLLFCLICLIFLTLVGIYSDAKQQEEDDV